MAAREQCPGFPEAPLCLLALNDDASLAPSNAEENGDSRRRDPLDPRSHRLKEAGGEEGEEEGKNACKRVSLPKRGEKERDGTARLDPNWLLPRGSPTVSLLAVFSFPFFIGASVLHSGA